MFFRNIIVISFLSVILLSVIVGEGYFYFYSNKQNSAAEAVLKSIQNNLKSRPTSDLLAEAQNNLQMQTEKLRSMQASFPSSPALDSAIKTQVGKAAELAARDNALVADSKLGLSKQANIIKLGKEVAAELAYLQLLVKNSASTVALNDAAQNAIELTVAYSNQVNDYINSLNSSNSNLSPSEVDIYKAQTDNIVAKVNSVADELAQIENTPVAVVVNNTTNDNQSPIVDNQSNTNNQNSPNNNQTTSNTQNPTNNQNNSNTQNVDQNSNQTGNSGSGSITLNDITNQENVVSKVSDQVNQLSDQIAAESTTTSATSSSDSSSNSSSSSDNNGGIYTGGNNTGQIQSQGGSVKLIQGENAF